MKSVTTAAASPTVKLTEWARDSVETVINYSLTPTRATKWLSEYNYSDNRRLDDAKIETYARQIQKGLWVYNGDNIRFDRMGYMIDGQHRCAAVIKAGKAIEVSLCLGLDTDVFTTIDRGKPKSNAQMLTMKGYTYSSITASAARQMYLWEAFGRDQYATARGEVSADEILMVLEYHPGLEYAAQFVRRCGATKVIPGRVCAFCFYLLRKSNPDKAEEFFSRIGDGVNLESGSGVLALRERMLGAKAARKHFSDFDVVSMIIRAWNAYARGKPLRYLRGSSDMPKIYGLEE